MKFLNLYALFMTGVALFLFARLDTLTSLQWFAVVMLLASFVLGIRIAAQVVLMEFVEDIK